MLTAKEWHNKIMHGEYTRDELLKLIDELNEWYKQAPTEMVDEFTDMGAGECLAIMLMPYV